MFPTMQQENKNREKATWLGLFFFEFLSNTYVSNTQCNIIQLSNHEKEGDGSEYSIAVNGEYHDTGGQDASDEGEGDDLIVHHCDMDKA